MSREKSFIENLGTELLAISFESPGKSPPEVLRELEALDARVTERFSTDSWVRVQVLPLLFSWAMIACEYDKARQAIESLEGVPAFGVSEPLRKLSLLEMKLWLASCCGTSDGAEQQVNEALEILESLKERIEKIAGELGAGL